MVWSCIWWLCKCWHDQKPNSLQNWVTEPSSLFSDTESENMSVDRLSTFCFELDGNASWKGCMKGKKLPLLQSSCRQEQHSLNKGLTFSTSSSILTSRGKDTVAWSANQKGTILAARDFLRRVSAWSPSVKFLPHIIPSFSFSTFVSSKPLADHHSSVSSFSSCSKLLQVAQMEWLVFFASTQLSDRHQVQKRSGDF